MMQHTKADITFPIARTGALLTLAAALAAGGLWLIGLPADVVLTMGAIVWLSALLGVMPVAVYGPRGLMPALFAYYAGAGVRILLCLAAVVVLIKRLAMPAGPVVVTLMTTYLLLLFVEVKQVMRFIRISDLPTGKEACAS